MDRRSRPTGPLDALRLAGRRTSARRRVDRQDVQFFDRFDAFVLALIVSILGLTIVDGVLTVELLGVNCEEANPVMKYMLYQGQGTFFVVKYILTAVGLPFLLVFKNHLLFGTRFRVGYIFPVFLVLYLVLVAYEVHLLRMRHLSSAEFAMLLQRTAAETATRPGPRLFAHAVVSAEQPGEVSRHRPRRASIPGEKQALAWSELTILPQQISIQLGDLLAATDVAKSITCNAAQGLLPPDDMNGIPSALHRLTGLLGRPGLALIDLPRDATRPILPQDKARGFNLVVGGRTQLRIRHRDRNGYREMGLGGGGRVGCGSGAARDREGVGASRDAAICSRGGMMIVVPALSASGQATVVRFAHHNSDAWCSEP